MSTLKEWEDITNKLVKEFCLKYFERDDYDWVGDRVGDAFWVSIYCFDLGRVIDAIKYNATYEQLIEFEDLEDSAIFKQDAGEDVKFFSFKNFIKYSDQSPIKEMIEKLRG